MRHHVDGADHDGLDSALAEMADFHRREASGVVAQLVEHHNGIVGRRLSSSQEDPIPGRDLRQLITLYPLPPHCSCPGFSTAVSAVLRAKEAAKRRPAYIASLRQYLTQFCRGRETQQVSTINAQAIDEWFASRTESPSTMASNVGRLRSLFSFCKRRGWIRENPCDFIERITVERRHPRILTANECARLLQLADTRIRAWVVLGLFAGLRPLEASRLTWAHVRLSGDPCIVIDAAASKVRSRRVVRLRDPAPAWLSLDRQESGPIVSSHSTLRRARRSLATAAGITWDQDILRHTHASMRLAAGDSADTVSRDMGNSPRVLLSHYYEMIGPEEAAKFWRIVPHDAGYGREERK